METISKEKCPVCGAKLQGLVLTVDPPIHLLECPDCGYQRRTDKFNPEEKPPLGVKPYYIFYAQRIRELADAVSRHAGKADDHCVYEWLKEIMLLRSIMHMMRSKEFYEEDMK